MRKKRIMIFLVLLSCSLSLWAQKQISGTVTSSEDGTALPGVAVVVQGTSFGTTTDNFGAYSLKVPDDALMLSFSFIGYKKADIEIAGQTVIDVVMEAEVISVDEVIVVGYGSTIKSELTGAINKLKGDDLQRVPATSFESSLQGKSPGVFMTNTTGKLGEGINIRVRGTSSISANNQPLYVVDGIIIQSNDIGTPDNQPLNPLMTIDPKEIETIEVLKDASASAIYGSRASNGVVIITTKSGKGMKGNNITFGASYSVGKETNRLDLLNAKEYIELLSESAENAEFWGDPSYGPGDGELFIRDYFFYSQDTVDTDWQDEFFQTAYSKDIYMNAYGGNENSTYYAGISYSNQDGILRKNGLERINGRLNFTNTINKIVDIEAGISFAQTNLDRVAEDNAFATPTQLIAQAPITPAYLDGEPNPYTIYFNGILALENNNESNKINRTISNGKINIHILPKILTFSSVVGADVLNQIEETRVSSKTDDGLPSGKGYQRNVYNANYTFDNYFTLDKEFLSTHKINATVGMSYMSNIYKRGEMGAAVFPSDNFNDLDAGSENLYFGTITTNSCFVSYFGRLNYKMNDKYLISASLRDDGSSNFGQDNRWGLFYSIGAGWIASRESFIENISFISFLKPRISYGTTGNANIDDYAYFNLARSKPYAGKPGVYSYQLGYSNLSWETTNQLDLGIDFGFFDNRISGEIDYYNKSTEGLLLAKNIPRTNGYGNVGIYENVGELTNKGFEFLVNATPVARPLEWRISLNFATNTNKITKLNEPFGYEYNRVEEGQPLGFFYMPKYAGVDPDNGDALYYDSHGNTTNEYDSALFQMVGNPNPKYYGGMTNQLSYKGFDLTVLFQFVADLDVYKKYGCYSIANADWVDNQTRDQLERWQNPGDITDVPQARLGYSNGTRISSRYISDASYLRLKDVTLSYNLPSSVLNKVKIKNARVYISTKNLLTFTKYTGFDPEVSAPNANITTTNYNVEQGIDYYSTPQTKSVTFGIDVTF